MEMEALESIQTSATACQSRYKRLWMHRRRQNQ